MGPANTQLRWALAAYPNAARHATDPHSRHVALLTVTECNAPPMFQLSAYRRRFKLQFAMTEAPGGGIHLRHGRVSDAARRAGPHGGLPHRQVRPAGLVRGPSPTDHPPNPDYMAGGVKRGRAAPPHPPIPHDTGARTPPPARPPTEPAWLTGPAWLTRSAWLTRPAWLTQHG